MTIATCDDRASRDRIAAEITPETMAISGVIDELYLVRWDYERITVIDVFDLK
jgi:hypothetical protein